MKNILLIDADSKNGFPNLVLMKISAWHKAKGNHVDLIKGIPTSPPLGKHDKAYASCVFFQNKEKLVAYLRMLGCDWIAGGSGWNLSSGLVSEIEHIRPDYALYPTSFDLGFTSRGCIRHCGFCVVPQKEGTIRDHAPISEFHDPEHDEIILLDNNFLSSPRWRENLAFIKAHNLKVNFNQGLDIRLVNREIAGLLAETKSFDWKFGMRGFYFAFDSMAVEPSVCKGVRLLEDAGIKARSLMFYILVGYNTTQEEDLHRIEKIKELGAIPYIMPFNSSRDQRIRKLARWVNRRYYQFIDYEKFQRPNEARE